MVIAKKPISDKDINELLLSMEHKHGKGVLYRWGEQPALPRVSTGLPDLDKAIGGGLVRGRLYELYGPESAGKTSLALKIMSQFSQALFVDAEGTFTESYAALFGNGSDKNEIWLVKSEYGEQAIDIMVEWARKGVPLIVLDSVPSLLPKAVAEKDADDPVNVAPIPRLLSNQLPRLMQVCGESGTMLIFINQIREKVGMIFGDPTDSPGGKALKHNASLRLQVGVKEQIKDNKLEDVGHIIKIRVRKSKISEPKHVAELPFIYNRGFVPHEKVDEVVDELRVAAGYGKKRPAPNTKKDGKKDE